MENERLSFYFRAFFIVSAENEEHFCELICLEKYAFQNQVKTSYLNLVYIVN